MSLKRLWLKNFLIFEFGLSVVLVILLILTVQCFYLNDIVAHTFMGVKTSFYATVAQIEGSLLGFVIAGVSILLTMSESPAMIILKKSPFFRTIFEVFTSSAKYFALSTIISLVAMVSDKDDSLNMALMYLVIWCIIITILRLARCLWILDKIIDMQIKK